MNFDPHHNPAQRIEDILEAIASIKESVGYMTIIATGAIPYLDNAEVGFRRDCAHEQ